MVSAFHGEPSLFLWKKQLKGPGISIMGTQMEPPLSSDVPVISGLYLSGTIHRNGQVENKFKKKKKLRMDNGFQTFEYSLNDKWLNGLSYLRKIFLHFCGTLGTVAMFYLICRDRLASDAVVEDHDSDHDSDESLQRRACSNVAVRHCCLSGTFGNTINMFKVSIIACA